MRRIGFLLLMFLAGCGTAGVPYAGEEEPSFRAARFTNLSDPACRHSLSAQVASVLVKEGETGDAARKMATDVFQNLWYQTEPAPFFAFSPGGMRYGFFLQETEFGCVLRLYERRQMLGNHGLRSMDTLDYLASRTVLYCSCSEPDTQQDIPQKH
jgi:hypothetical protein